MLSARFVTFMVFVVLQSNETPCLVSGFQPSPFSIATRQGFRPLQFSMLPAAHRECTELPESRNPDDHIIRKETQVPPILARPHERAIFVFYGAAGSCFPFAFQVGGKKQLVCVLLATAWGSWIMAISFMEAWVKFRAPFLPKFVAVDVGRHVFASLQAAELGLCAALWVNVQRLSIVPKKRMPLVLATASLFFEALVVSPKLYLRAKARIVEGFRGLSEIARNELLTMNQRETLKGIASEVDLCKGCMPSRRWHSVYGGLELFKVVLLGVFIAY